MKDKNFKNVEKKDKDVLKAVKFRKEDDDDKASPGFPSSLVARADLPSIYLKQHNFYKRGIELFSDFDVSSPPPSFGLAF